MSRNVPKLRFNGFDGELKSFKFKQLVKLQRGSSPRPIVKYITDSDDGVNWIKIGDVSKGETIINSTKEKITKEGALKSRFVQVGDLILSNSMSYGRPYIMGIDGYIHDGWFVLRDYENNFKRDYLCQLLTSSVIQKQYKKLAAGGVVDNISSELVNSVSIKLPSLQEQEKIVNFLSKVDSIIEKQEKKVQYWNSYKKGMMQKIFSQKIRFKDKKGRNYPEWEKVHLNKFVERVVRKNKDNVSKRPLTISAQYGLVDQEEFFNKLVASKNLEGYYLLKNGEFAYNKSYSTGYPFGAIKRLDKYENGAVSTLYICFKVKNNINSDFIVQYFESSKWHKEIAMIAVEGARNHGLLNVSVSDFFETIHYIPCLEEQNKISKFLLNIDNILFKENKKLEELVQWKKGLLQQMFI